MRQGEEVTRVYLGSQTFRRSADSGSEVSCLASLFFSGVTPDSASPLK